MSAAANEATESPSVAPTLTTLVPYLTVDGAGKASDFYVKAFEAKEVARYPLDEKGRTMHIHLHINGASLMLSDAFPEHGHPFQTPQGFNLTLQVKGIDQWWARAIAAGCTSILPVQDMFWGDRYGQLRDPFGIMWSMNEPKQA
jgi:PhnB protein